MFTDRSAFKLKREKDKGLYIGKRSLEQHLLEADISQPFYIKELLSKQDWTLFTEGRSTRGRKPYEPESMIGLIFYGLMQGISSLRDLERMARVDLGCMLITGGIFPDFSSIGYFIRRHEAVLTECFFINLTKSILKITRSGVRSLAGDGTIIEAAASRYKLMRQESIEKSREKIGAKLAADPESKSLTDAKAHIDHVSKTLQARIDRRKQQRKPTETTSISLVEPDAVVQPTKKGKASVPAYKPSVLANEARIVVAIDVHPSNEITSLKSMLNLADKAGYEERIEELLLDGGYECHEVLQESINRDVSVLCAVHKDSKKKSKKRKEAIRK